ncbi:MAG: NUDIX hydrolase [Polyangiaceae bacterium]|nr:NUDIX hydrolase [Polyangiaceae bacterium]
MPYSYEFERPALAVDCVVFGLRPSAQDSAALSQPSSRLVVLLIERALQPFEGRWALPGGFVRIDETLDRAAERELVEESGLSIAYLEQLYTFGELKRDPRERVVSVAYFALVNPVEHVLAAGTDAAKAEWFDVSTLPSLAFDHGKIIEVALERLRSKVRYRPIGFGLLPELFTLTQLQKMYETILDRPLDKRNFRKKIASLEFVVATEDTERGVPRRAARLFRFDQAAYDALSRQGFDLELI